VAQIDEETCIGCTKCLPPCPVDAIVGARKLMHTVVAELCNGCELCIAPCPVDCIKMVPRATLADAPPEPLPQLNRERFYAHNARLARLADEQAAVLAARKQAARSAISPGPG
jgi:electron transport complex protein RnfB